MMRARYGTGVFLKLEKRNCEMRLRLTPYDNDFLRIHWRIGGDDHYFLASGVMGSQFSAFLSAVYGLYEEADGSHWLHCKYDQSFTYHYPIDSDDGMHHRETGVHWDEEGYVHQITFIRKSETAAPLAFGEPDPVRVMIRSGHTAYEYTVDGHELCYAVARGCTEALKKYGLKGYTTSTGGYYLGDAFGMEKLLFVKAYALDALEVCQTKELWAVPNSWIRAEASDFEKEMELFLFDM